MESVVETRMTPSFYRFEKLLDLRITFETIGCETNLVGLANVGNTLALTHANLLNP